MPMIFSRKFSEKWHITADRRYACGDCYAGKACATVERLIADRRYACGDGNSAAYCFRSLNQDGFCLVVQYAPFACIIRVVNGYRNAGKAAATGERITADRRYACGDCYAGKACATGERITFRLYATFFCAR